jgi:hypothetical protein
MTTSSPDRLNAAVAQSWRFLLGMVLFSGLGFGSYFLAAALWQTPVPQWVIGILLLAIAAGIGLYALTHNSVSFGSGVLVGYALAAIASGGQCTLFVADVDYGALSGALVYAFALIAVFVLAGLLSLVNLIRK